MRLPAEQGLGIAGAACVLQRAADVFGDTGETLEVAADHVLCLVGRDLQPASQAPAADAVQDGEVDRLGPCAGVAVDGAEQFGRGQRVNVVAAHERLAQLRHVGHVGGEAKLDLAVVGGEQHRAFRRDEGLADLAAHLGADRNVLQVRIGRRQPPGLGAGQRIAGVDASRPLVDLLLQRIGVGGLELGELPPFEHLARDRHTVALQPLQLVDVGGPDARLALAPALQTQPVEQHLAQLLGAADREGAARQLMDLRLHGRDLTGKLGGKARQMGAVDQDATPLHTCNDGHQGSVDLLVNAGGALARQTEAQVLP